MESCSLFMVGMLRSGSSLLAHWLKDCGLDIGMRLPPPVFKNEPASFEDLDFSEFHKLLLKYNGASTFVNTDKKLTYDKYLQSKAKSILFLKRLISDQWGVKQPRATLFLDLWRNINTNEAYYITIVRDFWEVVSSLHNRELKGLKHRYKEPEAFLSKVKELEERKQEFYDLYLSMWIRYNEEIIDHYHEMPKGNHLVLWMGKLIKNDKPLFDHINKVWDFDLTYQPISELYKPEAFHELTETEFEFSPDLHSRAIETEQKLRTIALESEQIYLSK